jgi:hypothetical protein
LGREFLVVKITDKARAAYVQSGGKYQAAMPVPDFLF